MLFPSFFAIRTPSSFRPALAINPESLSESLPPQPRGSRACVLPTFIQSVHFYGFGLSPPPEREGGPAQCANSPRLIPAHPPSLHQLTSPVRTIRMSTAQENT